MYNVGDTIVAVSSPNGGARSIVRITGPQTLALCEEVFVPGPNRGIREAQCPSYRSRILFGAVRVNEGLAPDARLYLFFAPHSYTGELLAEIHLEASPAIVAALMQNLLARGLRPAGPGEFTARAYLNGKLDLAQAEAVNEVISSSNRLQLDAAERLLSGRLTKAADEIRSALLDCLSLLEAGLDFSGEDIEFISAGQAAEQLAAIRTKLEELRAGSIRCETLMDLPAIGIAGAPNAGKSSLLNALLGWERSIVSDQPRTTRDVLSGILTGTEKRGHSTFFSANHPAEPTKGEKVECPLFQCVLFDCAGLVPAPGNVLDELAQRTAVEALGHCSAVIFCVDATKPDIGDDIAIRALIQPRNLIYVATKCDLVSAEERSRKVAELKRAFDAKFLAVSAKTAWGLDGLLCSIERLVKHACASASMAPGGRMQGPESAIRSPQLEIDTLALTARHQQSVTEAVENVRQAIAEVNRGNEEVAVMMIRAACQELSEIEQQPIDEQVLDRIFSRFCIGK